MSGIIMGCYNDEILFIHIPKCAGWSVKQYLKANVPGITLPDDENSKLPIGHIRLQDIERFTGRSPDSFKLILAIIREPYEQQLSQWCFWRDRYARGQRHIHDVVAAQYATVEGFLSDPRCDFHVWYEQHLGFEPGMTRTEQVFSRLPDGSTPEVGNRYEAFGGCYRYWITVDDEIPGNVQVIRCEELDTELPKVLAPFIGHEPPPVPRLNRSFHGKNIKAYYSPIAASLVEAKFQWAFECHYAKWLYSDFGPNGKE